MTTILHKIETMRIKRNWSEYQLAEKAGIPQSTISSWYQKGTLPTIPSLEKICNAFGITLSVLFAENNDLVELSPTDKQFLEAIYKLDISQRESLLQFLLTVGNDCLDKT